MRTWNWSDGDTKPVRVVGVQTSGRYQMLTCRELAGEEEWFLLIDEAGTYACESGQTGVLTFRRNDHGCGSWWFSSPA